MLALKYKQIVRISIEHAHKIYVLSTIKRRIENIQLKIAIYTTEKARDIVINSSFFMPKLRTFAIYQQEYNFSMIFMRANIIVPDLTPHFRRYVYGYSICVCPIKKDAKHIFNQALT